MRLRFRRAPSHAFTPVLDPSTNSRLSIFGLPEFSAPGTWLLVLWLGLNLLCFLAFGLDKLKARRGRRRIRERTLLLLALPGSAPGAWLAMGTFRHKTQKRSFRLWMALVTLLNALLVYGIFFHGS